ncbi:expressed protein [Phakopsora pachyrhizi]|uniref:Expressed protein n=1 Tax=Phakopsora pachyrhizi TaxID=170000 RepID=A0AAV0AHS2_PHAPC|nr:expressed protein [Phakopsora pachyrhizi]
MISLVAAPATIIFTTVAGLLVANLSSKKMVMCPQESRTDRQLACSWGGQPLPLGGMVAVIETSLRNATCEVLRFS